MLLERDQPATLLSNVDQLWSDLKKDLHVLMFEKMALPGSYGLQAAKTVRLKKQKGGGMNFLSEQNRGMKQTIKAWKERIFFQV